MIGHLVYELPQLVQVKAKVIVEFIQSFSKCPRGKCTHQSFDMAIHTATLGGHKHKSYLFHHQKSWRGI